MLAWRFHETRRPVTPPAILIPPLGMSTGFMMFVAPPLRFPFWWGVVAFLVGAVVFAIPLAHTSRLEREGNTVVMRRSPAFIVILLVLVAIRFALRSYIDRFVSPRPFVWEGVGVFFVKDEKIKEWSDYTIHLERG